MKVTKEPFYGPYKIHRMENRGVKVKRKQPVIAAFIIFVFCLATPIYSNAEGQDNEYQSNGDISFYGEYIPLTEEEKEANKELPQTTKDKIIYAPLNQGTVNQKYTLPQTGEQLPINMMITGFVLLGLAYIVRKQKI